jgi:hypothetical protein
MKSLRQIILIVFVLLVPGVAVAQVQLILLKRGKVVLRLDPGDTFIYRQKGSMDIHKSYVNNLSDTTITTRNDEVSFRSIDRIYFSEKKFYQDAGQKITAAGILLFAGDQINNSVVQGNDLSLDRGVCITSISLVAIGLPMALIKKNFQTINYKYRLMTIRKGSALYK